MAKPDEGAPRALADRTGPLLLVGCGNMAGAILTRWLDCGLAPELVHVVDPSGRPVPGGVSAATNLPDRIAPGTLVLLGIKPQNLADVAPRLNAVLGAGATIVSMLAGIPIGQLREALPAASTIVRIMPNLPVRSGDGIVLARVEPDAQALVAASVERLLGPLGLVELLADEAEFDLATAVSGCGPAYVYRFADALAEAARRLGMDPAMAGRLALHTVAGAAVTALRSDQSPAALADAVASPGGMTREGMNVLDADDRLIVLLTEALCAARDRGAELARVASGATAA